MGVTKPYSIKSKSGQPLSLQLADCVNVRRTPHVRQQILDGTFHRTTLPDGEGTVTIEKQFFYVDFDRNTYILVKPPGERHLADQAADQLQTLMAALPDDVLATSQAERTGRVAFGLGELREKLVAEDAKLDDRMVELLKVLLVYEHPFLLKRPRLRIFLENLAFDRINFVACYDHADHTYRLAMPRSVSDNLIEREPELRAWVAGAHKDNVLEANDTWVNFASWSPKNRALRLLRKFGRAAKADSEIDTGGAEFKFMLQYLPSGNQLPSWAKRELRELFLWIKKRPALAKLQDALFEIRFARELEDDWHLNDDPEDIDTLWKLLKDLPDTNVEGNTSLNEIFLEAGEGGGWYNPGSGDIHLGSDELADQERFEDVMRHEVGHAVHEMHSALVDEWLMKQFGWRMFGADPNGIDAWVNLMGGYGSVTPAQRSEIRGFLIQALGPGSKWGPPRMPTAPAGHPWRAANFGPRIAAELTGANWYDNNKKWYRIGNVAFFLNYYYGAFMTVNTLALDLINQGMPDTYAAMSPYEFFAELYALFYDLDDPQRDNIPKEVVKWMKKHIGAATANQPARPSLQPARRRSRGIARPAAAY